MIQVDRRGTADLAQYGHLSKQFSDGLSKFQGFSVKGGSSTDIAHLCDYVDSCGINISAGYYNQHGADQCTDIQYLKTLPDKVKNLIEKLGRTVKYKPQRVKPKYSSYSSGGRSK